MHSKEPTTINFKFCILRLITINRKIYKGLMLIFIILDNRENKKKMTTKQKIRNWFKKIVYIKNLLKQEHELKKRGIGLY